MKLTKTLVATWFLCVLPSHGAVQLLGYGFDSGSGFLSPTITSPSVSGSDVQHNNGTVSGGNFTVSSSSGTAFVRQRTSASNDIFTATTLAESISRGVYLGFTATILAGSADLTSLDFDHYSQDLTGGSDTEFSSNLAIFASFDGFATAPVDGGELFTSTLANLSSSTARSIDLATGAYDGLVTNTEVSFRFYQYSADGSLFQQVTRLDNVILNGNAVPEPSAPALVLSALVASAFFRRR